MIDINRNPSPREIKIFSLLWLLFFGLVAVVAWFKPGGLLGGAMFLGLAWATSLVLNKVNRKAQLAGAALPALFAIVGASAKQVQPPLGVVLAVGAVGLAGALLIFAVPAVGRLLYVGWMVAAVPIGWTISHLVLAAVYYLVLTPIGCVMRLAGYDPMKKRFERSAASYWIERKPTSDPARYFRQF